MKRLLPLITVVLSGCAPGFADYSESIGNTGYTFHRTSSINKAIRPDSTKKYPIKCDSIKSVVLAYDYNKHVIAAVRQVKNNYSCEEGYLSSEITNKLVFEYISLYNGSSSGSLTLEKLKELSVTKKFQGIDTEKLLSASDDIIESNTLEKCTNPKHVNF